MVALNASDCLPHANHIYSPQILSQISFNQMCFLLWDDRDLKSIGFESPMKWKITTQPLEMQKWKFLIELTEYINRSFGFLILFSKLSESTKNCAFFSDLVIFFRITKENLERFKSELKLSDLELRTNLI